MLCAKDGSAVFDRIRTLFDELAVPPRQRPLYLRILTRVEQVATRASLFMPIDVPVAVAAAHGLEPDYAHQAAAAATLLWAGADLMDDASDGDLDTDWDATPHQLALLYTNLLATLPHLVVTDTPPAARFRQRVAETLWVMSHGQFDDLESATSVRTADDYCALIARKTGMEIAFCAAAPAVLADLPGTVDDAWQHFGLQFGCMVQLFSDICSTFEQGPRSDLRRGKRTLPVLVTLAALDDDVRPCFEDELARTAAGDDAAQACAIARMHGCAAVRESLMRVELFRYRAAAALPIALDSLPPEHVLRRLLKSCSVV